MSITGRNLTWMFGIAAGTALAFLANRTSKTMKRITVKDRAGYRGTIKPTRQLYNDSEINYI